MAEVRSGHVSEAEALEAATVVAASEVVIAVADTGVVIAGADTGVAIVADTGVAIVAVAFAAAAPGFIAAAAIAAAHGPIPGAVTGVDGQAHGAAMRERRGAAIAAHRAG